MPLHTRAGVTFRLIPAHSSIANRDGAGQRCAADQGSVMCNRSERIASIRVTQAAHSPGRPQGSDLRTGTRAPAKTIISTLTVSPMDFARLSSAEQ